MIEKQLENAANEKIVETQEEVKKTMNNVYAFRQWKNCVVGQDLTLLSVRTVNVQIHAIDLITIVAWELEVFQLCQEKFKLKRN
jgi:hypothetical protein